MRLNHWGLIVALGALLSGASHAAPSSDVTIPERLVVYVDAAKFDASRIESRIGDGYDFDDAVHVATIETKKARKSLDAYIVSPPDAGKSVSGEELRSWMRDICRVMGVRHVEAEVPRRTRGQPFTIPILDGDLDMSDLATQAAMVQVRRDGAASHSDGSGTVIAVLDGGFQLDHEALVGRLTSARFDAIDFDQDPEDTGDGMDQDADGQADSLVGHGSFVASLILTAAPGAKVMPIRVLDDEGWGTDLAAAMGIQYAVAKGADVINMSLVLPDIGPIARDALAAAISADVTVVTASGNLIDGLLDDPWVRSRSVTVGAVDTDDVVLAWSPNGPDVDVFAPGAAVAGALAGPGGNAYGWWDGTSFASAMASGAAALVASSHPALDVRQVRDRVAERGHPVVGATPVTRKCVDLLFAVTD